MPGILPGMTSKVRTPELAAKICEELEKGKSLRAICREPDMPTEFMVRRWAREDDVFGTQYTRARLAGYLVMADEITEIADEQHEAVNAAGKKYDPEVNRDKLRVDTRKWMLSKMLPKVFGDKLALEHSGNLTISERLIAARKRTLK